MSKLKINFKFKGKQKENKGISYDGVKNKESTILNINSKFYVSEAYKTLRTNILFSSSDYGCKSFVVTSAIPGEGKTTNAINLAISFAQTEKKVVLIDADLRKPKLHKYFEIGNKVGISNVISGVYDGTEKDFIQKTHVENLDLITSGHIPPNPIELLASDSMYELIKELEANYDYIIIDTPPINVVSDALVLSKTVTGYILVTRSDYTEYQSLSNAMSTFELANIKPLGVILNDFTRNTSNYSHKGKYKYKSYYNYYRYGN
ncbi:MAG: CpsD/CapB family tyrosine-protein kinase [Clostridia bacterium]|nr:CpsD/CapB family tyrosine-protein kinase [Clostridia bacterium]